MNEGKVKEIAKDEAQSALERTESLAKRGIEA